MRSPPSHIAASEQAPLGPTSPERPLPPAITKRLPQLRGDRRQIVVPVGFGVVSAVHHGSTEREVHQVRPLEPRPRSGVAERRHPGPDEVRKALRQNLMRRATVIQVAASLDSSRMRRTDQLGETVRLAGVVQVDHHGLLGPVVQREEQRSVRPRGIADERSDRPRRRTAGWSSPIEVLNEMSPSSAAWPHASYLGCLLTTEVYVR